MSAISSQFDGNATALIVAVTDTATTFIGALDLQRYDAFALYVENIGGGSGNDITSIDIDTAPTASGPWSLLGAVTALPLAAAGDTFEHFVTQANKYIRVQANCGGGNDTTANFWLAVQGVA